MNNSSRNLIIGIIVVAVIGILGFSLFNTNNNSLQSPMPSIEVQPISTALPEVKEIIFDLQPQNNSSESGKAVLREEYGQVTVTLALDNAPTNEQPAHIHVGACPEPGAIRYPLSNVVNGISKTTIMTTIENLRAQAPLAINVHESPEKMENYVACGDLPLLPTTSGS